MPSANKTQNYGLNQWAGNEYPKRQDFVDDNAIIDAELAIRLKEEDIGIRVPSLVNGRIPKSQLPTPGGYVRQSTAPDDTTLLWVDSANGNVMKYYNGTAWAPVPATWG